MINAIEVYLHVYIYIQYSNFSYLYVVIRINIVRFLQTPVKFDHPTLRKGSRERKNASEQIKNMTLTRI